MNRAANSLLIWCISAGLAWPQAPPPIRSSTKLVQVTVIATGAKDVPVHDLTAKDFRISEEGQPQTIAAFETNSRLMATERSASTPAYAPFSNRPLPDRHAATMVLLLDTLDSDPLNWELVWPQVSPAKAIIGPAISQLSTGRRIPEATCMPFPRSGCQLDCRRP